MAQSIILIIILISALVIVLRRFIWAIRDYYEISKQAPNDVSSDIDARQESFKAIVRKVMKFSVLLIIVSALLVASFMEVIRYSYSFEYRVIISTELEENFTFLLPFPLEDDNVSNQIFDNLTLLSGNCVFKLEEPDHGFALNVTGNKTIEILSEGNMRCLANNLSLFNGTNLFKQ